MKVYAQDGHQRSDKITRGLQEGLLDGAIFSARYLPPERALETLQEARNSRPAAEILLDPEFYASLSMGWENAQLGKLEKWDYLRTFRRRDLVRSEVVRGALTTVFERVANLPVTAHIAPNVYIPHSFDSMEASVALGFIEQARECFEDKAKPVYATLSIDRKTLLNTKEFLDFLNEMTGIDSRPDGFYVLVGGGSVTERSDVVHSEIMDARVLGAWMMLNFALTQNGFRVINGFADIISPFLNATGAVGCATGWWSNLRVFSMGRYVRSNGGGGQAPIIRYLSKRLLNRIKIDELNIAEFLPEVINGLPHDKEYQSQDDLPTRTLEALQSWEALGSLNEEADSPDIEKSIAILKDRLHRANEAYYTLNTYGLLRGLDTNLEFLRQLEDGLEVFKKLAEL